MLSQLFYVYLSDKAYAFWISSEAGTPAFELYTFKNLGCIWVRINQIVFFKKFVQWVVFFYLTTCIKQLKETIILIFTADDVMTVLMYFFII